MTSINFLFAAMFLIPELMTGQEYYPLAIGNRWDYGDLVAPGQFQYLYSMNVIGDSVMPNGETYAVLQSTIGSPFYTIYQRQEGSRVYQFADGSESLLYDFSLSNGDTLGILISGGDTIVTVVYSSQQIVFGASRPTWRFYTESHPSSFYSIVDVADSIGRIFLEYEPGYTEYCTGAIIDGQQYGSITGTTAEQNLLPEQILLYQNYPNPFNPKTDIRFHLPAARPNAEGGRGQAGITDG